ncbi:MAG: hypothetical protein PUB66_05725 [Oscillospiraceae bacterium]|nr:hypothetical protein [Oscillospiraceae bacterium]
MKCILPNKTPFLCTKWAKENGYYYSSNDDIFVKTAEGYRVSTPLSDDNTKVLVTHYKANPAIKIDKRKTAMPNPYGKRKYCPTAKQAAAVFLKEQTPDKSTPCNSISDNKTLAFDDNHENKTPDNCTPCNYTPNDCKTESTALACTDTCNGKTPDNCTPDTSDCDVVPDYEYTGDYELQYRDDGRAWRIRVGGEDAGFVDGLCKEYETARSSHHEKKDECLDSCDYRKSCEIIVGTYVKQSFSCVQNAVSRMIQRTLFKKYTNLKCGFLWLEPYHNGTLTGGWHAHLILCFYDDVPAGLLELVLKSWKKRIIVPADKMKLDKYLVTMRTFNTFDELVKVIDYLNPTSAKKRDCLKYYPHKRKATKRYGDTSKPDKVIIPANESKKLTENEHINLRRETKILNASSTLFNKVEDVKVHNFQYYYSTSEELLRSIIANGDKGTNENKSSKADVETTKVIVDETENIKIEDYSERDNSGWHDYKYDWCMAHLY